MATLPWDFGAFMDTPTGGKTPPTTGTEDGTWAPPPEATGTPGSDFLGGVTGQNEPTGASGGAIGFISKASSAVDNALGLGGNGSSADQAKLAAPVNANAQTLLEEALAQSALATNYGGPQQIVAPTIAAPDMLESNRYRDGGVYNAYATDATGRMTGYDAALASAADSTARQAQAVVTRAESAIPAMVAGVNTNIGAPKLGPAEQTGRVGVERVQTSGLADALRAEQIASARGIANGPSAAMNQFKAGQAQNIADQLSMAAAARGSERAGARREAIIAAGQQGVIGGMQAAALAAQEEQAKRVAGAAAMSTIRAQDVTSATNADQIRAQQANLQAQIDSAIATGNTEAVNALRTKQAELTLAARQSEVQASLGQQSTQAGLATANLRAAQETNLANAANANKASQDYAAAVNAAANQAAQNSTSVSVANASNQTKAGADYAAAVNAAAQQNAQLATATSQANAQTAAQQANQNATRTLTADTTNQGAQQATNTANAANQLAANTANASNSLSAQQLRQGGATAAINSGTSATGVQADLVKSQIGAKTAANEADAKRDAALIGAAGTGLGAIASDERLKTDIKRVSDADLMDLADHMQAYTWRYKDGVEDSGAVEHGGAGMAQELERSALGKKFVHKDADGIRSVDALSLAGLMAAAAASSLRKRGGARA
jgi:hypothetical protein